MKFLDFFISNKHSMICQKMNEGFWDIEIRNTYNEGFMRCWVVEIRNTYNEGFMRCWD